MSKIIIRGETYTANQAISIAAGDTLFLVDCVLKNCLINITGDGNFTAYRTTAIESNRNVLTVNIAGALHLYHMRCFAGGQRAVNQWSAITIRSATGGQVRHCGARGYSGNGILVEAHRTEGQSVDGLVFADCWSVNNAGGMWLANADNCLVKNFTAINSTYGPGHAAGQVFPCIRDEEVDEETGVRTVGATEFVNVQCFDYE